MLSKLSLLFITLVYFLKRLLAFRVNIAAVPKQRELNMPLKLKKKKIRALSWQQNVFLTYSLKNFSFKILFLIRWPWHLQMIWNRYLHGIIGEHEVPEEKELKRGEMARKASHDPPDWGFDVKYRLIHILNNITSLVCNPENYPSLVDVNLSDNCHQSLIGSPSLCINLNTTLVGWMSQESRWIQRSGSCCKQ